MWSTIVNSALNFLASLVGYTRQRDAEKNTPAIVAAAAAKQAQGENDKATKAVAEGDINEIRRELSE